MANSYFVVANKNGTASVRFWMADGRSSVFIANFPDQAAAERSANWRNSRSNRRADIIAASVDAQDRQEAEAEVSRQWLEARSQRLGESASTAPLTAEMWLEIQFHTERAAHK